MRFIKKIVAAFPAILVTANCAEAQLKAPSKDTSPGKIYENWNITAPSRAENAKLYGVKLTQAPSKESCLKAYGLSLDNGVLSYQDRIGKETIERVNLLVVANAYTKEERLKLYDMFPDFRDRMTVFRTIGAPEFGERRVWNIEKTSVGCFCSFSDFSAAIKTNGGLSVMSDSTPIAPRVCEAMKDGDIPSSGRLDD